MGRVIFDVMFMFRVGCKVDAIRRKVIKVG